METKRVCKGICKKYKVKKPTGRGRYSSGQARCQICEIWIDHHGCHIKDGSVAKDDNEGWYCNCCNYRVRKKPRNIEYKAKIKTVSKDILNHTNIDLSHFNNYRATLLRALGNAIAQKESKNSKDEYESFLPSKTSDILIAKEFDVDFKEMINLAKILDPPNKVSLIAEFERVKLDVDRVPTKEDIEEYSDLTVSQYEEEFQSWEHLLERMGYDPWYRQKIASPMSDNLESETESIEYEKPQKNLGEIKETIREKLQKEPEMLELFNSIDKKIQETDSQTLEKVIYKMH